MPTYLPHKHRIFPISIELFEIYEDYLSYPPCFEDFDIILDMMDTTFTTSSKIGGAQGNAYCREYLTNYMWDITYNRTALLRLFTIYQATGIPKENIYETEETTY